MAKVLGVGGVFFRSKDAKTLAEWYQTWLGLEIASDFIGCCFQPKTMPEKSYTIWSPFAADTSYFGANDQAFMINLIVDDVEQAIAQVIAGGARQEGKIEDDDCGIFAWFIDPDGNKVELWQPK